MNINKLFTHVYLTFKRRKKGKPTRTIVIHVCELLSRFRSFPLRKFEGNCFYFDLLNNRIFYAEKKRNFKQGLRSFFAVMSICILRYLDDINLKKLRDIRND